MTTSVNGDGRQRIALDRIAIPGNVRELDADHVAALAASIKLRGLIVPVIVRRSGKDFELIAGFHRFAAHKQLREEYIEVDVREGEDEHGDRAIENIARKQLNPHEEARAVQAMLAAGLTEDSAAQALGWPKARVTARVKLLELPERAQELVGAGAVALSAVDQLRAIGNVSPPLWKRYSTTCATATSGPPSDWGASRAGCSTRRCARPARRCSSPAWT